MAGEAWERRAKNKASKKAWLAKPGIAAKQSAYRVAYRAKVLAKRMSAARKRLKRGKTSESATTILAQITTYLKSLPDDHLAYIFMSSEDKRSIKKETTTNKPKIVTMGGEERTYVEDEWVIVGGGCRDAREEGTGINGVPDDAGYVIARIVEALAVEENRDRVGNETGGGGGGIPRIEFLRSGRVCVGWMKRSEE